MRSTRERSDTADDTRPSSVVVLSRLSLVPLDTVAPRPVPLGSLLQAPIEKILPLEQGVSQFSTGNSMLPLPNSCCCSDHEMVHSTVVHFVLECTEGIVFEWKQHRALYNDDA